MQENDWQVIDAQQAGQPLHYKQLNALIRKSLRNSHSRLKLFNVFGQRFICAGLECPKDNPLEVEIHGIPGNDLGIFMDGPKIIVKGNAEDQIGNTMNDGAIIIEGDCRDVVGLSMRGGKIFVKGNAGYRIGIHMKEYKEKIPIIVIGGTAKEFFGEYMAGGILIALGLKFTNGKILNAERIVFPNLGNGIHGGRIYIRGDVPDSYLGVGTVKKPLTNEDIAVLKPIIDEYSAYFNIDKHFIWDRTFCKIIPSSHRPYAAYYTAKPI